MLAYTTESGEQRMERLISEDFAEAVERGLERLACNQMDADDAVLVFDGRITVDDEKLDAILLQIRCYFSPDSEAILAIPYTPKDSPGGKFLVHKPKLLEWNNCDDFDLDAVFQSFFEGVDSHKEGSKIWNDCLDESI